MEPADPPPAVLDHRTYVRYGPGLSASLTPPLVLGEPVQTVLGEAIPLHEVSFVVVDLETTGGSPVDDAITEIGAVRFEGAERVGSFQTLVDPERPIPPAITHLTGISDRSVAGAPSLATVLPTFLEFARGAVIVAHNAAFDVGFLNANLLRLDYPTLPAPAVCTAKLARRLVWPEVPNVRLRTLAGYFRTRVQPTHRALQDAEATGEVLQGLLDVGQHLGIHTLGELYHACSARGRPNFAKISLAERLPRASGVYVFRDRNEQILYVGKAKDLRARVKSYFYGDERKKVQDLVASVSRIDTITTRGELEALVLESRLIARHLPRFNAHGKRWRRYVFLKLDPSEAWPRWKVSRSTDPSDGAIYLGPFGSSGRATLAKEALEEAFPIRRCTRSMGRRTRFAPCALADMGRCLAPCDGRVEPDAYHALVGAMLASLDVPQDLMRLLDARMTGLAEQERFEEAALARDRLRALAEALQRARHDRWLTDGRLTIAAASGERLDLIGGALRCDDPEGIAPAAPIGSPAPRDRADELAVVRSWLRRHPGRVLACDDPPAEPVAGGRELAELLDRIRAADDPRSRGRPAFVPAGRRRTRR
ncbi:MAG TPA: DEDD exonuclease domain-containing protein [Actinomycetota bacterium]|nr:DEDD exonuclease domain-containing protein [Actinomycetota bacterium]